MKKLNSYQVCRIYGQGRTKQAEAIATIQAESLTDAYAAWEEAHDGKAEDVLIYPMAYLEDGASIYDLADYACGQHRKWMMRNNAAVMSALNRSTWDEEDERQDAAMSILVTLGRDGANMYDAFMEAFNALAAGRDALYRQSETEYNPAVTFCNPFIVRRNRPTYPGLARLIARAKASAGLTDKQTDVLSMYESGTTCAAALELLGVAKQSYYQSLYAAFFKVLSKAVELDGQDAPTFAAAGIDAQDIEEALEAYAKRARIKR